MAVGMDMKLTRMEPPARRPTVSAPAPQAMRPPAIADAAVQGAVNNQLAAGFGARELTLADSDRRGISRGKGHYAAASAAQDSADVKAAVGAAQTEMGVAATNAAARQTADSMMASERLSNANLLEGLRSASASERLARQGWQQDLYEAMRRGQFGLDQQQLDYTPLLRPLFD